MATSQHSQADIGVALLRLALSPAFSGREGESAAALAVSAESKHSSQEVLDVPGPARPSRSPRASRLSDTSGASEKKHADHTSPQNHAANTVHVQNSNSEPLQAGHGCNSPRQKIDEAPRPQFVSWEAQQSYDECYPESDDFIQVHIILDGSRRMSLEISLSDRVFDLKSRVCKAMDRLPLQCLRLKLSETLLTQEDMQLQFAGIADGSELTATITPMQVTRHIFCQRLHAYAGAENSYMFDYTDAAFLDPNASLESQKGAILPEGTEILVLDKFPFCNIAGLMWRQDPSSEVESCLQWTLRRHPPSSWEHVTKAVGGDCSAVRLITSKSAKDYFGSGRTDLAVLIPW